MHGRICTALAAALLVGAASVASAQTYVGSIDISTDIGASTGLHAAHIAVDDSTSTPVLYVNSLNNGAAGQSTKTLKIVDPLGTPAITTLDVNDGGGAGVSATRGSGGVAVDASGNVFVGWCGNGNDSSSRVRRYNSLGSLTGEWLYSAVATEYSDRAGGLDVNAAGTQFAIARFLSTATHFANFQITSSSAVTRSFISTPATVLAYNPRDIAFDEKNKKLYINLNGNLQVTNAPSASAQLAPASQWTGGTSVVLQNPGNNSFAGHGVGLNDDKSLIGYSPSQNAAVGANTFRITNAAGTTVYTLGTLDSPGNGTGALLARPIDAAFFSRGGKDYVAVTDYSLNNFSRVAIFDITPAGQYTWNGGTSTSFTDASNWTPARTTTATTDTLVIDGFVTPTATITGLVSQSIDGLKIRNNAAATITAPAAATLTINNGSADYDFYVEAGSSVRLTGNQTIVLDIAAAAKGEVYGDVIFHATAASVPHRINANAANALYFRNGATAAMAPVSSGAAGGFGSSSQGFDQGVIFESGSTYYQGGEKNGTFNGGTGSNPFARTAPAANVVFNSGATYYVVSGIPATSGRTYGNYTWKGITVTNQGGSSALAFLNNVTILGGGGAAAASFSAQTGNISVGGNLVVDSTAAGLNLNPAPTAAQTISLAGNVDLQTTASVTLPADVDTIVVFNGAAAQNLNFGGLSLLNATVNNAAGVTLTGNLNINGNLHMQAGQINTGAYSLTVGPSAVVSRTVDATALGNYTLPFVPTPVSFNVTTAGTGTGTVSLTRGTGPSQPLPVGAIGINRSWNLTANGITGWTATLVFTYSDAELGSANENNLVAARYNGSSWDILSGTSSVNTTANTVTVTGVTDLSEWTLVDASSSVDDWSTLHE